MPIYEYRCKECGTQFEVRQSMSDAPLTICPPNVCEHSGTAEVERVISKNTNFVLKGSGFYQTDYKPGKSSSSEKGSCSNCK